jgi:hypothetical protein
LPNLDLRYIGNAVCRRNRFHGRPVLLRDTKKALAALDNVDCRACNWRWIRLRLWRAILCAHRSAVHEADYDENQNPENQPTRRPPLHELKRGI